MISALTIIAVIVAIPAALAKDDVLSLYLGFNAFVWSATAVGLSLAVA